MKLARLLSTSALSFSVLLGTSSLIYAQEQHEEAKPEQHEEARPEAARPQDEAKPEKQDEAKPEKQDKEKPARDEKKQGDSKNAKQAEQAGQSKEQMQHASNNKGGGRIPDDKFRSHFGRQHTFVVNHPTVIEGQPRFQYGGYWFVIAQPWPVGWAYTDVVYVDYIDGEYFLLSPVHPGVQIAINVIL